MNPSGLIQLAQSPPRPLAKPSEISENFVSNRYDLPWDVVVVGIGAVLAAIAAVSLYRWWQRRNEDPSPLVIFSAIARKAGLSWGERYLLWRIARRQKLDTPIALLLARGTLRHHAAAYAKHLSPAGRDRVRSRIDSLSQRLFGPKSDTYTDHQALAQ
ncbi:MAG: hypothetical protein AAGC44_08785 [Planctomycetota bacterium]